MTLPALNFNESALFTSLRNFLVGLNLTTSGTGPIEIVQGQQSRVPQPIGPDYVVFWPLRRPRLATNQDVYGDCAFIGQVNNGVLSVVSIQFGVVQIGGLLYGSAVPSGTTIVSQLTGTATGGVGTYTVSNASLTVAPGVMAAGVFFALQEAEVDVQIDVHGPNSHDNAALITTLFRDDYAVEQFKTFGSPPPGFPPFDATATKPIQLTANNYTAVAPLHADDPRQIPFLNAEQQYENRWIIEARLQANQIISVSQQFTSTILVTLIESVSGAENIPSASQSTGGVPSLDFSQQQDSQYISPFGI